MELPVELDKVLRALPAAQAAFRALAPSHQREYVNWIKEAKKPETRQRRAEQAVVMLLGKAQRQ